MNLNHAMTTNFCQENGYAKAEQWIIGDENSGMYGQRVGYNIWGGDGHFNANDRRVHVDCIGRSTQEEVYTTQAVFEWLQSLNIDTNSPLSDTTYDLFCQQQENRKFKEKTDNSIVCHRSINVSRDYTPQDIARWYILKSIKVRDDEK